MRLTFRLRFHTKFGQSLLLTGNHEIFGDGNIEKAVELQYLNDEFWEVSLVLPKAALPDREVNYNYVLRDESGMLSYDWGTDKVIDPARLDAEETLIVDAWNSPSFPENAFYTEPFKKVLLAANHTDVHVVPPATPTHLFKVKAPLLARGQTLCLLGNIAALGEWNVAAPVLLSRGRGEAYFQTQLDLRGASFPITYKYGVYELAKKNFVRFEDGPNRVLYDSVRPRKKSFVNDGFARLPASVWKGAGVAVPVFSLRSENSFGVGEFTELKLIADWCTRTGLKMIQLLPVNDTTATHTWMDSYPYAAISAFALHPLYLNLAQVAEGANRQLLQELEGERRRLNSLESLDYEAVLKAKLGFVEKVFRLQKDETFKTSEFRSFFEKNKHWLRPYAAYCYLRDKYGTPDFGKWLQHQKFEQAEIDKLLQNEKAAADSVARTYFIQFHLHLQLTEATQYAHDQGIIVKGDIAIGVYRYGADAWQQPDLYHMEMQAGAPPDPFGVKGQNWGFPTYNWARMKADGFSWWKSRFEQMSYYFDAFRIDHILGFFRIWSIPVHAVEGILGYFVPAIPVNLSTFLERGLRFDRNRLTKPYITEQILRDTFGAESEFVKTSFLRPGSSGTYALKSNFVSQRQVESHFASLPDDARNQKLKVGLYDLISNVILFEVDGSNGEQFHFRFSMDSTSSFKAMDERSQGALRDLYLEYFFRWQDEFWRNEAMQKLPALKRVTNMLVCGEDLGMVPACVPDVMGELGLLSLEVQRMPKLSSMTFSRPADASYLSVVTPSTHDMSTIRGWWAEEREQTQKFFNEELGLPGPAPVDCAPWVNRAIVLQHLASPAMWSVFQLQELLGMSERLRRSNPDEERINVPANPKNYWRYRMHLSLEALCAASDFNDDVRKGVLEHGR
jgi:4-alpha-glucanotransferase